MMRATVRKISLFIWAAIVFLSGFYSCWRIAKYAEHLEEHLAPWFGAFVIVMFVSIAPLVILIYI